MSYQQYLFNRSWAVSIAKRKDPSSAVAYDSLKTTFEIDKTTEFNSNKGKISLHNLDAETRKKFTKGDLIRLKAGYYNLTEIIYFGEIITVTHERKGADVITTFLCGDSENSIVNSHFEKSYPEGTTAVEIVKELAEALGVDIGIVIGIEDISFGSGISLTGTVGHCLKRILQKQNLEYSVQNGSLQIIPKSKHTGEEAVLLTPQTGLIGVPSQGTDCFKFKSLILPRLKPGRLIQVQSETVNGYFKIRKSKFEGDTHSSKWNVDIEASKISAKQALPPNIGNTFIPVEGIA